MTLTPRLFQSLVVASVAFAIGGVVIDGAFDLVPEGIRAAELEATPTEFTTPMLVALVGGVLIAIAAIAGIVGLLKFRHWGRRLSVVTTLIVLATYPFLGVVIASAPASTAYETSSMLWGAVLAIAYFSPLSSRFDG